MSDGTNDVDLVDFFGRHTVSMAWTDYEVDQSGEPLRETIRYCNISAFVISILDAWFLVTAGHVLNNIERMMASGRRMKGCRLSDRYEWHTREGGVIPFDYESSNRFIVGDVTGYDLGLIPLSANYQELLRAGGVVRFGSSYWKTPPAKCEYHFMAGFPTQFSRQLVPPAPGADGELLVTLVLLPIRPTRDIPECLRKDTPRFYGKLDQSSRSSVDGKPLDDIDGMSGAQYWDS